MTRERSVEPDTHKEAIGITNGNGSGVTLSRDADTGHITQRQLLHLGRTDVFTANHLGWLLTETNSQGEADYAYRADGVRDAYTLNERTADFIASGAGVVTDVRNAVLGMKLREPVEGTLYPVGGDGYGSVTTAVKQVFQALGGGNFNETAVIYVHAGTYAGETRVRETGRFADDFDDGTGAAWSGGSSTSGSGAANLTQSSVRRGSAGYAPEFSAGHGDEAYLSHTFSPTFGGTFADSVYLRIVSEDLSTNDTATLFVLEDSSSNSVIELRLEYGTNTVLAAYYQHDSGGGPALVAGSALAVNAGAWYDVAFVYTADTDTNSSTGNGRFRWWVDGSAMTNVTTVNGPTNLTYKDMTLGATAVSNCNVDVIYDVFGIGGLNPSPDYPLVVRGRRDHTVKLTGKLEVGYQEHVRVQGMRLAKTGADGVVFSQADGVTLASCLVESDVLVSNCLGGRLVGNTFLYGQGTNELEVIQSEAAMMRNNIFMNQTNEVGWTSAVYSVDSDYNCYSVTFPAGESNSVAGDPDLHATYGFITNYASIARGSGVPRVAMSAVYREGWSTKIYDGTTTNFSLADNTPGIHDGLYYYDEDADVQYGTGEDIWRDENTNGVYDEGVDTLVWTNGALDVSHGDPGTQEGLYYDDADSDRAWDSGEGIWVNATAQYYGDGNGWYRHLTTPCMGAIEYEIEVTERDAGGRVDKRTVAGRVYEYEHDARGQLSSCTDNQDSSNTAQYAYDHMARRTKMTVGDSVYRFVYDGNDVAVEFCDEDGDDDVDRTRVYWLLPELDQRIGFVDVADGETNIYYYLCDQVGSVIQIVDESGDVVNQYVYDAYGNVSWDSTNTFEGVENRYLFQGREWDAHRQEYYFRFRTYIPEWGSFAGPDMNLSRGVLSERHGMMSYVAFGNNPLDVRDPMGLTAEFVRAFLLHWESTGGSIPTADLLVRLEAQVPDAFWKKIAGAPDWVHALALQRVLEDDPEAQALFAKWLKQDYTELYDVTLGADLAQKSSLHAQSIVGVIVAFGGGIVAAAAPSLCSPWLRHVFSCKQRPFHQVVAKKGRLECRFWSRISHVSIRRLPHHPCLRLVVLRHTFLVETSTLPQVLLDLLDILLASHRQALAPKGLPLQRTSSDQIVDSIGVQSCKILHVVEGKASQ